MLTPPNLPDSLLLTRLADEYHLHAGRLAFLPLGADVNTAVYHVENAKTGYFLKLRRGAFNPITVELPAYLHRQGLHAIIPPLPARSGSAWARLNEDYVMMLSPFVEGRNAYEQALSDAQWQAFGTALAHLHATRLPDDLRAQIPVEPFPARERDAVRKALADAAPAPGSDTARLARDPVAIQLISDLRGWREQITRMLDRTDALAEALRADPPAFVLCHSDVHAGNLHLTASGDLYLVDWDAPLYAPKERDLLLIGGCPTWPDPRATDRFYQGYGTPVESARAHPAALIYYRYQRVIEDIAAYCRELLYSEAGGADRERSLRYLRSNFLPGGEIDFAVESDRKLME